MTRAPEVVAAVHVVTPGTELILAGMAIRHTGQRDAVVQFDGTWLEMGDTDGVWSVRPLGWGDRRIT